MISKTRYLIVLFPLLFLAAGCASVEEEKPFEDVRENAEKRSGQTVEWTGRTTAGRKIRQKIDTMLEEGLTVEEAVQVALLNNPRLQGRYEDLGIARAELVEAGLLSNPVFGGSAIYEGGDRASTGIEVLQNFIDIFMIPLRKKREQSELEQVKLEVTGEIMDLALDVRRNYYNLQAAQQRRDLMKTVRETTGASYEMAQELRKAGNINQLALLQERSLHEQTKLDLSRAELEVTQLRESLNEKLGFWSTRMDWEIPSDLPPVPEDRLSTENLEKRVISDSLDLAIARKQVEIAAEQAGITRITSVFPAFEAGFEAEEEGNDDWVMGPALEFPLPIFDQGQAERSIAHARLKKRWRQYTSTAIQVRSAARVARDRLKVQRDRAVYYRDVMVPLQKRILNRGLLRFNAMFMGVFRLLNFKRQEISVRRQYINELRDYWIARAELEQILQGRMVNPSATASPSGGEAVSGGMGGGGGH